MKMPMKKKLIVLLIIFVSFDTAQTLVAQQIGEGYAPSIADFNNILTSGVYGGANANGATSDNSYGGWQHLFVIRHESQSNNHQCQLATSYSVNDRLFFRKIAGAAAVECRPEAAIDSSV
jgi:hypothetical protein